MKEALHLAMRLSSNVVVVVLVVVVVSFPLQLPTEFENSIHVLHKYML